MKNEQFIDYQNKVYQIAVFLLNPRLDLLKQLNANENKILWSIGAFHGTFFVFYHSVFDSLVVTLSWLFSDKEERGLIWYLNQVKEHSKTFSKNEIDAQLKEIKDNETTISKIKTVRDKWIAHRDASAHNNPDKFLKENEIDIADLENLVKLAEAIIQAHFGKFQDTAVDFELPSSKIGDLARCVSQRQELLLFLEEFHIAKGKPDFTEKIIQARNKISI